MFKYFFGADTYAARQVIDEIAHREQARIRWIDREQLEGKNIDDIVGQSQGLLGKDMVVVRDPSDFPKALQDDMAAYAEGEGRDKAWILWDRVLPDKRSKLWRTIKTRGRDFPVLPPRDAANWLTARAQQLGGVLDDRAADLLVARMGLDRWRLENEIKRLILFVQADITGTEEMTGAGLVSSELVERELAAPDQAEIFATLDALMRGDTRNAVLNIESLLTAGHSEFYILAMLAYQFRTLLIIRAGLDEKKSVSRIAIEGKLHPYVVEKNMPVARHLSVNAWRDILTRILAADFAIKRGKVDAKTGLLMLVLALNRSMQSAKTKA